ncbi:MAG: glycosyltransferase family 2 protein [Deltaproteobacteria bacterium]|nr:glycosyltransferase family 2 protein [Deltaproteobacteria bacterium]
MPEVSVIVPTYNRREFVHEAMASVYAQTFLDFELLVVDDGSTDGTAEVMLEFPDARYLWQENLGVSAARNAGAAASRGHLLAFLDSDDLWQPRKLATQVDFFHTHPEAQICQTEEIWLRNGMRINPHHKHRKPSGDIFVRSLALCLVSPSAVMLRRAFFEQLGGFDEHLPACEDYDLWLRIAAMEPVHLLDEPLVIKRGGHADQLSRQFWGMDRFRVKALCKLLDSGVLSPEQYQQTVATLQAKCAILAHGARKRGQDGGEYVQLATTYAR